MRWVSILNKSDSIKQIIIFAIIMVSFVIGTVIMKKYFVSDNDFINDNEIKDKYEYNEFRLSNVTNEVLIQRYFIDFKDKMLNDTLSAYNMLGNSTKDTYKTYDEFKSFVDSNKTKILSSYIVKYNIQHGKSTNNYIVVDQYDNQYTFTAKAVLVYTVNLELYNENSSIFE